ncbi:MAG: hypothetical protein ACLPN5_00740 [Roseiarcus sp.]
MATNRPESRCDVPWSKRREIPDSQILDAANQYENACRLLSHQPPGSGVLLPFMNTAAISIELYLKSLSAERLYTADTDMPDISIVSALAEKTGHKLKTLFNAISKEIHAKLTAEYDKELRPKLNKDFITALKEFEGVFEISRYPYEPPNPYKLKANIRDYNLSDLADIAKFLRSFVESLPVERLIEYSK